MTVEYKASFHNHSQYSDGSFQVEALVDKVASLNETLEMQKGISINGLAIVDHDFYPDESTEAAAKYYASQYGIDLLFGSEISADNDKVHIVGYGIDASNFSFQRHVVKEQYKRLEAFEATCRLLNHFFHREGKEIDLDRDVGPKTIKRDMDGRIVQNGPLRWHYLRQAMVERGMAATTKEANVLIGPVGPCYHQRETIDSVTAVERVLKWGGKPVLAHPHKIPEEYRDLVIRSLCKAGLMGIEAYTGSYHEPEPSNIYVQTAKDHNLMILSGTDLHADINDIGKFLLPYEVLRNFKSYQSKFHCHDE
jgi:3',5'-nucleoside bisphosphate phosphatase